MGGGVEENGDCRAGGGSRGGGNFNQGVGINRGGWKGGRGGGNDGRTPDINRGEWGNLIRGGGQSGDIAGPGNSGRKCSILVIRRGSSPLVARGG